MLHSWGSAGSIPVRPSQRDPAAPLRPEGSLRPVRPQRIPGPRRSSGAQLTRRDGISGEKPQSCGLHEILCSGLHRVTAGHYRVQRGRKTSGRDQKLLLLVARINSGSENDCCRAPEQELRSELSPTAPSPAAPSDPDGGFHGCSSDPCETRVHPGAAPEEQGGGQYRGSRQPSALSVPDEATATAPAVSESCPQQDLGTRLTPNTNPRQDSPWGEQEVAGHRQTPRSSEPPSYQQAAHGCIPSGRPDPPGVRKQPLVQQNP